MNAYFVGHVLPVLFRAFRHLIFGDLFYIVKNASKNQSNDIIMARQMILPDNYLTKINNVPQEIPA